MTFQPVILPSEVTGLLEIAYMYSLLSPVLFIISANLESTYSFDTNCLSYKTETALSYIKGTLDVVEA